jgi:ferredoxin-type protein NapF
VKKGRYVRSGQRLSYREKGVWRVSFSASRARFLRGNLSESRHEIHPPWAVSEQEFLAYCTRCGDCISACAQGLLEPGSGGFPHINFAQGACSFCGDCARACPDGALKYSPRTPPWRVKAVVTGECLALRGVVCRSCGEHCDSGAIHFRFSRRGVGQPQVSAADCTGCGACHAVCPVRAISLRNDYA